MTDQKSTADYEDIFHVRRLRAEVERLKKAICPDGTVTDVDGLEDIAVDGAHALEANTSLVSEVERLKKDVHYYSSAASEHLEKIRQLREWKHVEEYAALEVK